MHMLRKMLQALKRLVGAGDVLVAPPLPKAVEVPILVPDHLQAIDGVIYRGGERITYH
jgi:hypothetical protein